MTQEQFDRLQLLFRLQDKLSATWLDYWQTFSFGTWQFWINVLMLLVPIGVVLILLDKTKALLLGFYGYTVHMLFTYIDAFGSIRALWYYPFKVVPILPISIALDVSLVPVTFMLVYQWTLNHKKNYYLYTTGLCLFFAFVFKPVMSYLDLFELNRGTTFFHLLPCYLIIMLVSKWITNLFLLFVGEKRISGKEAGLRLADKLPLRGRIWGKMKAR